MRKFLLTQLAMLAIMATTFVAGGYAMPYYFDEETVVTADTVKFVRGNGFYSMLTYEKHLKSGREKLEIISSIPMRSAFITHDANCACVTDVHRNDGKKSFAVFVNVDSGESFYVLADAGKTEDGRSVTLGWFRLTETVQPELDEALKTITAARQRFAGQIPKS